MFPDIFNTMLFPAASCIAMGWFVKYTLDNNREDLRILNEAHQAFEDKIVEAIKNNTSVMTSLCEKLDRIEDHEN